MVRARCRYSARGFNLPGRFGFGRTLGSTSETNPPATFQSARQIWVWPNPVAPGGRWKIKSFNLPGRFGFGRTPLTSSFRTSMLLFQSARQIWVWPNRIVGMGGAARKELFQSARQIWVWPNPGRFFPARAQSVGFNLPGRFGFGRTAAAEPPPHVAPARFNLPGRFGFGRTLRGILRWRCPIRVSICQADLGLAEHQSLLDSGNDVKLFQSARQIWVWLNLDEFGMKPMPQESFNLPGRFGFG